MQAKLHASGFCCSCTDHAMLNHALAAKQFRIAASLHSRAVTVARQASIRDALLPAAAINFSEQHSSLCAGDHGLPVTHPFFFIKGWVLGDIQHP